MRRTGKTKTKTKKTVSGIRKPGPKRAKKEIKPPAPSPLKQQAFSSEEVLIERQKFSPAQASGAPHCFREELPLCYGREMVVLQVRDPRWLHAYWELQDPAIDKLRARLKDRFHNARLILRVYDVSLIIFDGNNAHSFFDIDISLPNFLHFPAHGFQISGIF